MLKLKNYKYVARLNNWGWVKTQTSCTILKINEKMNNFPNTRPIVFRRLGFGSFLFFSLPIVVTSSVSISLYSLALFSFKFLSRKIMNCSELQNTRSTDCAWLIYFFSKRSQQKVNIICLLSNLFFFFCPTFKKFWNNIFWRIMFT